MIRVLLIVTRPLMLSAAHLYCQVAAWLTPRQTRHRVARWKPYADLVGWKASTLDHRRRAETLLAGLDEALAVRLGWASFPLLRVEGEAHIGEALSGGCGLIIGSEHYGLPKIVRPYLHAMGLRTTFVATPTERTDGRDTPTWRVRNWITRRSKRAKEDGRGPRPARDGVETLQRGEVVCIATDGGHGEQAMVPFLGGRMERPTGPARLAYLTGAPIVLVAMRLDRRGRYLVQFHPPLYARRDLPKEQAVREATERIAQFSEHELRMAPWRAFWRVLEAARSGGPVPEPTRPASRRITPRDVVGDMRPDHARVQEGIR